MRIIIYGINYTPELTGIGKYTGEMGAWLANAGHEVSVVTAIPYYPEWKIHEKYKGKLWHREYIEGVRVYRCPLYVPKKLTPVKRILHELSFLLSAFPIWFFTLFQKKYDTVICVSPPFHLGLLPVLYSKIRNSKLISHVQDLQLDAAKELGMIKNNFFLNSMFRAERFIMKNSKIVSTISPGMLKKIMSKGVKKLKIVLFPNWVDEQTIKPMIKSESLRKEFGLKEDDKVVLYSGNLGEKQGLDDIIKAAMYFILRKDVYFILVGNGSGREKLENAAKEANLTNVKFFPLQLYEKLSALLAIADVHLVLQKKSVSDLVMPSKLINIMATGGCPIVTAQKGSTLFDIVSNHNVGILIEPENVYELKMGIEKALETDLQVYRLNARQYAEKYLSKTSILQNWVSNLV
jgi:colanic acid biosynthesis glycosyl transferase WcaI